MIKQVLTAAACWAFGATAFAQEPPAPVDLSQHAELLPTDSYVRDIALAQVVAFVTVTQDSDFACPDPDSTIRYWRKLQGTPNLNGPDPWIEDWIVQICDTLYSQTIEVAINPKAPPQQRLRMSPKGEVTVAGKATP